MIGRLITPVMLIFLASLSAIARAQGPFPEPQTGPQTTAPSPSPPVACADDLLPLREEAERRGQLAKAAGARHASAAEHCKLLGNLVAAEVRMIKYVEANPATCGISPNTLAQFRAAYETTQRMQAKACAAASVGNLPLDCCVVTDFGDPVLFPSGRR
jgi:hypothetical protein